MDINQAGHLASTEITDNALIYDKVDLRTLPNPEGICSELEAAYVPTTEVEQTIAAVWQEVLHLDQVGIYNNFFDIGGDSLLLTKVHKQLLNVLKKDISITQLFKYPTIKSLANYLKLESNEPPVFPKVFPSQAAKACSQSTTADSPRTKIKVIMVTKQLELYLKILTFKFW